MAGEPFRFVHAADFHLEQPLYGFPQIPEELRDLMIDAPFVAARRVFATAINEHVDFVVLSGDILHPQATGPRAIAFLLEQFELLREEGIQVYWAGGNVDVPERWPREIELPDNVHVFSAEDWEEVTHHRDEQPLATIVGQSSGGAATIPAIPDMDEGEEEEAQPFRLVVVHGETTAESLGSQGVDYCALGGRHGRETLLDESPVAHYPGSPQGRCPREDGEHGCTLVHVSEEGEVHTQPIHCDAVRWHNGRLAIEGDTNREDLQSLLRRHTKALVTETPDIPLLISWKLQGNWQRLTKRDRLGEDLLEWLQHQFGRGATPAWTLSLEFEPPETLPPEWYEEDTILGDFLRAVRERQEETGSSLDLKTLLEQEQLDDVVPALAALSSPLTLAGTTAHASVLREAAMLGADLLRGEDAALYEQLEISSPSDQEEMPT